ncbi:MAG: aminotransferase class III-fold pyridoxal phosphate-dependent enzyme [Bacteroidota bacterium]
MNLYQVYNQLEVCPVKGKGAYVFDASGKSYLDFYGGHAVISIGHSHPHYVQRVQEQVANLGFYSNAVPNPLQTQLAQKLGELSGLSNYQLFLCNSGAEANENALKLASFKTGRTKIIAFKKGFHGRTAAAVNATDNPKLQAAINKGFEVEYHGLNHLASVKKSLATNEICAVIIEGIQGIGGIHFPHPSFLEALAELCHWHGSMLILDEVQSGYGRSGHFFAFQKANIKPDLITVAKGMGNGFPIGGVLIHPHFEAKLGQLGSTFGGNHLAMAAGLAVLEVIEQEQLMEHAQQMGALLDAQLQELPGLVAYRGAGLMIGLEFDFPIKALRKALLHEHQVFTGSSSDPNVLRLLPPLNISEQEVHHFTDALQKALQYQLVH